MRQNGRIPHKQKEILNFKEDMKKNKMRHYETLNGDLFPQDFPKAKMVGKQNLKNEVQNCDEPRMDYDQGPQQPKLDKIWEWLGNPDEY